MQSTYCNLQSSKDYKKLKIIEGTKKLLHYIGKIKKYSRVLPFNNEKNWKKKREEKFEVAQIPIYEEVAAI